MNKIVEFSKSFDIINIKENIINFILKLKDLKLISPLIQDNRKETFVGLVLILIGAEFYYWQKFKFWSKRNIKTPLALPIFGNSLSFLFNAKGELALKWRDKYGKLYGYYVGTTPKLVCADANVLKLISIKDFDKFPNRLFVGVKNKYQKHFLITQEDDHWRGMRSILTPTFSSLKMKIIFNLVNTSVDELIETIKEIQLIDDKNNPNSTIINTKEIFRAFSMNSSLKSFYGLNLRKLSLKNNNNNNEIDENTNEFYAKMLEHSFELQTYRLLISSLLPESILKFINFPLFSSKRMSFFGDRAKKIVEHRVKDQQNNVKFNDYLQLLIDSKDNENNDKSKDNQQDKFEEHHAIDYDAIKNDNNNNSKSSTSFRRIKLTEEEIFCQTMMLMMVATETTSTSISNTIYLLAFNKNVQDKLFDELIKIKNQDGSFDYDSIIANNYLDSVVSESLRLMSPAVSLDRIASEDYYIKDYDLLIPKGTVIDLNFSAILRDPDYWPEPEKFNPDRFMPENKSKIVPGSYCPFGVGPRACIGFRFALLEVKLCLAKLITTFYFEIAPGTIYPPKSVKPQFIFNEFKNLNVIVKQR